VLPGVEGGIRVTKPYKLASREMHRRHGHPAGPGDHRPGTFTVIAGPCSVENEAMILRTAEFLVSQGVKFLRAGAFKPRTSPYAFQGLGIEGLKILAKARQRPASASSPS
jgi:3-deoxy-7-phosphoheptulonate synthase